MAACVHYSVVLRGTSQGVFQKFKKKPMSPRSFTKDIVECLAIVTSFVNSANGSIR